MIGIKTNKVLAYLLNLYLVISLAFLIGCGKAEKTQLNESICIETAEECSQIFSKGANLPISHSETFSNLDSGQEEFHIALRQGEDSKTESNRLLGTFDMPIIRKGIKEAEVRIQATFIIDRSKKFTMVVKDLESGRQNEFLVGIVN